MNFGQTYRSLRNPPFKMRIVALCVGMWMLFLVAFQPWKHRHAHSSLEAVGYVFWTAATNVVEGVRYYTQKDLCADAFQYGVTCTSTPPAPPAGYVIETLTATPPPPSFLVVVLVPSLIGGLILAGTIWLTCWFFASAIPDSLVRLLRRNEENLSNTVPEPSIEGSQPSATVTRDEQNVCNSALEPPTEGSQPSVISESCDDPPTVELLPDAKPDQELTEAEQQRREKASDRWGGWLLIFTAVLDLAWRGFAAAEGFALIESTPGIAATAWNVISALGLFWGGRGWRKFACIRACIGILFGMTFLLNGSGVPGLCYFIFNAVWCVGLLILLGTKGRAIPRGVGLATAACAQISILCTSLFATVIPEFHLRSTIRAYSVPAHTITDDKFGYKIDLPSGWVALLKENPIIRLEDAKVIAVNRKSGAFAAFLVEPAVAALRSPDDYLNQVESDLRQRDAGFQELERTDIGLDGHLGRGAHVTWHESGQEIRGTLSVARQGWFFYSLRTWSGKDFENRAASSVEDLQRGIGISPEASQHFASEFLRGMRKGNPFLSDDTGNRVMRLAIARNYSLMDVGELMKQAVERGRASLNGTQQREVDDLYARAFAALPERDHRRVLGFYARLNQNSKPAAAEVQAVNLLVLNGVRALPPERQLRFKQLFNDMVDAGLNQLN